MGIARQRLLLALLLWSKLQLASSHQFLVSTFCGNKPSRPPSVGVNFVRHRRKREVLLHPNHAREQIYSVQCGGCPKPLFTSASSDVDRGDADELARTLRRYGFGGRLVTLTNADLSRRPILAEMYEGGGWKMCLVLGIKPPSSSSPNGNVKPPLLDVLPMNSDGVFEHRKVIDIGKL